MRTCAERVFPVAARPVILNARRFSEPAASRPAYVQPPGWRSRKAWNQITMEPPQTIAPVILLRVAMLRVLTLNGHLG